MKDIFVLFTIAALLLPINESYCSPAPSITHENSNYTPTVDSLLNLIEITSGSELLKLYPLLHKALYEVGDINIHLLYNTKFAEVAKAAKDKKAEAIARVLKIEALYNYRMPDSIMLAESLKALDFMKDVPGAEVHYFYTASVVGDIYMLAGNYEEALKTAEKFYKDAKKMKNSSGLVASLQTMGKAYEELGLSEKAEVSFRESIAAADERTDTGMKGEAYSYLVDMLNRQKRYNEALETSKEFEEYLNRIGAYEGELKNLYFLNYLGYAASFTKLGQYHLAEEYILKAEQFPVAQTGLGMYSVENERYQLLFEQDRYAEAEESLDLLEKILEDEASSYEAISRIKEARAELYHNWGRYDKAANAYKEYITEKDSLQRVEMANQLNALHTQYEVDKLEMQTEQQKRIFRNTLIWLSAVLLLLFMIIAVMVFNARRLRVKNLLLLNRIREQDKLEKENEQMRIELALKDISVISTGEENGKLDALYLKIKELMEDPAVFTNPDINRKMIAEKLATNEKYIFDTIRKYYDMSISDYITHLRLNYALNLLANPAEKRTIEAIALDAGFNSRSTFYRLFREHYGMTPTEFRQLITN